MNEYTCPVCAEPCHLEYDVEGIPVYTCENHHDIQEFDMEGFEEEFKEEEFEF